MASEVEFVISDVGETAWSNHFRKLPAGVLVQQNQNLFSTLIENKKIEVVLVTCFDLFNH